MPTRHRRRAAFLATIVPMALSPGSAPKLIAGPPGPQGPRGAEGPSSTIVVLNSLLASNTASLPKQFLSDDMVVEPSSLRGVVMEGKHVCILLALAGNIFTVAVAGAEIPEGKEPVALRM